MRTYRTVIEMNNHSCNLRNGNCNLKLRKIKLGTATKCIYYIGAKIYKELPTDVRRCADFNDFNKALKINFNK